MTRTDTTFSIAHISEGETPLRCDYDGEHPQRCTHRATFVYRTQPYCLQHASRLAERDMAQLLLDLCLELRQLRAMSKH